MARKYKCKFCGEYSESTIKTPAARFCTIEHAKEYAISQQRKARASQKAKLDKSHTEKLKRDRAIMRARKLDLKPLKFFADKAQAQFNRYIRLRDKGLPCVSCGKPDSGSHQRHASHYRSRGACSYLRFDEMNVHASCAQCNNHLSGNIEGYTPELIRRIGQDEFNRIMQSPKTKKYTREELEQIEKIYKEKCKSLENSQ